MRQSFSVMLAHQLRRKAERWEGSTKMKAIFTFSSYHLWNQNTFPGCVKKNLCLHGVSQRLQKREWHGTPAPDSSEISNMEVLTNPKMQSGRQTKKGIIPCSMTSWLVSPSTLLTKVYKIGVTKPVLLGKRRSIQGLWIFCGLFNFANAGRTNSGLRG